MKTILAIVCILGYITLAHTGSLADSYYSDKEITDKVEDKVNYYQDRATEREKVEYQQRTYDRYDTQDIYRSEYKGIYQEY